MILFKAHTSKVLYFVLLILSSACGQRLNESILDAHVTETQYQRAYEIVKGIDYIPFRYTTDGCYARAYYMAAELAAESIPSSALFAIATNGSLVNPQGQKWRYHVAVAIQPPSSSTPIVLDPSMFTAPVTAEQWIAAMGNAQPKVVIVPGSYYAANNFENAPSYVVGSFDQMPPFSASNFDSACGVMYRYLQAEGAPYLEERQRKLLIRSRNLILKIDARGKFKNDAFTAWKFTCGNTSSH